MANEHYVIATGRKGRDRLRVLTRVFAKSTTRLLNELNLIAGMSCLDVGCGGGDVTVELARRVGPTGHVLGIDLDAISLDLARKEAVERNIGHVAYKALDVADLRDDGRFDVVYARFLLSHLPDPSAALAHMVRALKPGGIVAVEDVEFSAHFCFPDCPAFRDYVRLYGLAARKRGNDPDIGPRLPSLLCEAGVGPVEMDIAQPAGTQGEVKLISPITMEHISEAVIASGLVSAQEAKRIVDRLYAEARDEQSVLSTPRIVQAWGRKS